MTLASFSNQELRTRKDLLNAAARLLKQGRKPNMSEVASEALVSRATAYRYFRSVDALLAETAADAEVRDPDEIMAEAGTEDPALRVDIAEAALHEVTYRNEAALRLMLAHSIASRADDIPIPKRQNRRGPLIDAALAPARVQLGEEKLRQLRSALSVYFEPESMIVFRNVLRIGEQEARSVKSWAVQALVRAALEDSNRA